MSYEQDAEYRRLATHWSLYNYWREGGASTKVFGKRGFVKIKVRVKKVARPPKTLRARINEYCAEIRGIHDASDALERSLGLRN